MFKLYSLFLVISIRNAACASSEEIEQQLVQANFSGSNIDAVYAHASRTDLTSAAETVHGDKTLLGKQLVALKVSRSALLVINVTDLAAEYSAAALHSCGCTIRHVYRSIHDYQMSEDRQPLASATKPLLTLNTVSLESLPSGSYSLHLQCSKATCQLQPSGFRFVLNNEKNHTTANHKQQVSQRSEPMRNTSSDTKHSTHSTHSTHSATSSGSSRLDVQLLKAQLTQRPADNLTLQKLIASTGLNETQLPLEATLPASILKPLEDPAINTSTPDSTCNPATGSAVSKSPDTTQFALVWLLRASLVTTSLLLTTRRSQACVTVIVHKVASYVAQKTT